MVGFFKICKEALHAILCRMSVEYQGIPLSNIFFFEGLADIVCYSMDLFYCRMLLPKTDLMIWQCFQIL